MPLGPASGTEVSCRHSGHVMGIDREEGEEEKKVKREEREGN